MLDEKIDEIFYSRILTHSIIFFKLRYTFFYYLYDSLDLLINFRLTGSEKPWIFFKVFFILLNVFHLESTPFSLNKKKSIFGKSCLKMSETWIQV